MTFISLTAWKFDKVCMKHTNWTSTEDIKSSDMALQSSEYKGLKCFPWHRSLLVTLDESIIYIWTQCWTKHCASLCAFCNRSSTFGCICVGVHLYAWMHMAQTYFMPRHHNSCGASPSVLNVKTSLSSGWRLTVFWSETGNQTRGNIWLGNALLPCRP